MKTTRKKKRHPFLWLLNFPIVSWHTQSETPLKPEQCEELPRGIGEPFTAPHFVQRRWVWFQERFFPLLLFISCPTSVVPQRLTCLARWKPRTERRARPAFHSSNGKREKLPFVQSQSSPRHRRWSFPPPTYFFCLKQVLQSLRCTTIRALIRHLHVIPSSMCSFLPVNSYFPSFMFLPLH